MIERSIKMHPLGSFLVAENNRQNFGWLKYISELIDNAFDANASNVIITMLSNNSFSIQDDGVGCKDLQLMARYGERYSNIEDPEGRYGVGGKDVAVALWGIQTITSVSDGLIRSVTIDWDTICKTNFEQEPKETTLSNHEYNLPIDTGTEIIYDKIGISNHYQIQHRRLGHLFNEKTREDLQWRYFPILSKGKQIIFRRNDASYSLRPFKLPLFEESFEFKDESINGKPFSIFGGIVRQHEVNPYPGFNFCRVHRVIEQTCSEPCGDYGAARIFAIVQLGKEWGIERNKERVEDPDREELMFAIGSLCGSYIEKASKQSKTVRINDLANILTQKATELFRKAKEQRDPPKERIKHDPPIRVVPKYKYRRQYATKYQEGFNPMRVRKADSLKIEFGILPYNKIHNVDLGDKTARVILNEQNSMIDRLAKDNNQEALLLMAVYAFGCKLAYTEQLSVMEKFFPKSSSKDMNKLEQIETVIFNFTQTEQTSKKLARIA